MKQILDTWEAITTILVWSGIITFAIPASREFIMKYMLGNIQLNIDKKMAQFSSDIRKAEEELKRDIRASEQQIQSIANIALSTLSQKQNALYTRQIHAIEKLWAHKAKLDTAKWDANFMRSVKFDEAARATVTDAQTKDFFKMSSEASPFYKLVNENQIENIEAERPFLPPDLWAIYSSYRSILILASTKLRILASGLGMPELVTNKKVDEALKAILPEYASYIDEFSAEGHYHLLDALEEKAIIATQALLHGSENDEANVERARNLYRLANVSLTPPPPTSDIPEQLKVANPASKPDHITI